MPADREIGKRAATATHMTRVGVVCGYDLNADLPAYVTSVASALARVPCEVVIFSGGQTSPVTWHSEAWTIADGVHALLPELEIILEERAMTTLDNLVFAHAIAEHSFPGVALDYVVFCDAAHARKVRVLAHMILGMRATVIALPREVALRIRIFEPISTLFEMLGVHSHRMRRVVRAGAVLLKGLTAEQRRSVLRAAASAVGLPHRRRRTSGKASRPASHPLAPRR